MKFQVFIKLIALIPPELITFYESNKDVLQPPLRTSQWTWWRPIIIRYNVLKIKKTIDLYAKQGSFHKDFVPIEGNVLFIIDARCGGNNDNPWTSNNYRELVKNIERWITKNVQWNTILLLPPNLLASNILSKLQLNSEHM
jgi:hypothetical protein